MRIPKRSPWGKVDNYTIISDDIIIVSTSSHGGYAISKKGWQRIASNFPNINEVLHVKPNQSRYFLEEDCEWCFVVASFPEHFSEKAFDAAKECMKYWFPREYMHFTGETLSPSESYILAKEDFAKVHEHDLVGIAGWGIRDAVFVIATYGGKRNTDEEFGFIVDTEKYHSRSQFGYVIDPETDTEIDLALAIKFLNKTTDVSASELMQACSFDTSQSDAPTM